VEEQSGLQTGCDDKREEDKDCGWSEPGRTEGSKEVEGSKGKKLRMWKL
jgi:hypothetical protein